MNGKWEMGRETYSQRKEERCKVEKRRQIRICRTEESQGKGERCREKEKEREAQEREDK